jgi:drug/metabolite transporter (DMT)-like permease
MNLGHLSLPVIGGLVITPMIIAAGQVLFKLAAPRVGNADVTGVFGLLTNPYLMIALTMYGLGTIVWVYLLKFVPLSFAHPFMAITFCLVPFLSWYFLGETLTWRNFAGIGFILAGLVVIAG